MNSRRVTDILATLWAQCPDGTGLSDALVGLCARTLPVSGAGMSLMTDDGVFEASAGPQVDGQRSEGTQAVRAAFAAVFDAFHDAHWASARHFIAGDRSVSEWTFTGTQKDGKHVEVTGCDLFTFRDGKIAIKNSYRKNRPAI